MERGIVMSVPSLLRRSHGNRNAMRAHEETRGCCGFGVLRCGAGFAVAAVPTPRGGIDGGRLRWALRSGVSGVPRAAARGTDRGSGASFQAAHRLLDVRQDSLRLGLE